MVGMEELRTGVDVKQPSGISLIFCLPLFGVLASTGQTMPMSLAGTAFDSSVPVDETVSDGSFSGDFFLDSLFLVFRGAPARSCAVIFLLSHVVAHYIAQSANEYTFDYLSLL